MSLKIVITGGAGFLGSSLARALLQRGEAAGPDGKLAEIRQIMLVDLVPPDRVERLPEPSRESLLAVAVPRIELAAFEASTGAKLRLALARIATT